jgi:hypothetical protein
MTKARVRMRLGPGERPGVWPQLAQVLPRGSDRPVDVDDRPAGKAPGLGEIQP